MSNLVSDDLVVVIDFDSSVVRIKQGITDVNLLPSLNIPCSLALPIGEGLTNEEGEGNTEGVVNFEDASTYDLALIGEQLKNADTTKYKLVNPLESNKLKKIDEFKLFLYLIIVKVLKINLAANTSALMLILPPKFNKNELELITQFCFENLNTPGLYIINRPMATLYGHGSLSGLVIDIGETSTHINPIMDNSLPEQTIIDVDIGIKDLKAHWLGLFKADADLNGILGDKLNDNFVNYFKETILPSLNETEGEADDDKNKPKEYDYERLKFSIKDEIFDQMWDALFKPELNSDKCLSLQHSIYNCLQKLDHDRRPLLTDNITFSGSLANVPGLSEKLELYFQPFLSTSLNAGYTQINKLAFLKMPEYFSNYKGKRQLMTILGGMIASKGIFNDYKNYVNKFDYNKLGPVCIHAKIN